jgi:AcrR family transcriptional regulator
MKTGRQQRRIEQTRLEILEAAAKAFAKKGIERTTVHEIARESGYTAASLYAYFPGKMAIVEGLLGLLQREILATFDEAVPAGLTFAQSIELLTRRQLEFADRRRDAMSFFIQCGSRTGVPRPTHDKAGFELYVPRLAAFLARSAKKSDLGGLSTTDAATCFAGVMHGFVHRWLLEKDPQPMIRHATLLVRLFLHGVSGTVQPVPSRRQSR